MSYNKADKNEFEILYWGHGQDEALAYRKHQPEEATDYFGDPRYLQFWIIVFESYCKTWGKGSLWHHDTAQTRIYEVEGLVNGLGTSFEKLRDDEKLTLSSKIGVRPG